MRFIFSAPFRTNINLKSLHAIESYRDVNAHVTASTKKVLDDQPWDYSWEAPWDVQHKGELHYSELSEDFIPLSATPLLRLIIPTAQIEAMISQDVNREAVRIELISDCYVEYYDNTIAVLIIDVRLSFATGQAEGFRQIDKWSTRLCSTIIDCIKPIEADLLHEFVYSSIAHTPDIFLKPEDFVVFTDRKKGTSDHGDAEEEMLWVTRLYFNDTGATDTDSIERWAQQVGLTARAIKVGRAGVAFCVGNSVIFGDMTRQERGALLSMVSVCTYFYVLLNIFNRNLKSVFLNLSKDQSASISLISRINKTRAHIEFIENEFSDVILGLQGLRCDIAQSLLDTWNYSGLVDSVQRRRAAVGEMLNFALQEKQSRYGRAVEAILAAIGGVAVLDFTLNLFVFSDNEDLSEDTITGLVDGVKYLPVDGALYAVIALLIGVIFLVTKKR